MKLPSVHALFRYPIKSFSPEPLKSVTLTPGAVFPGDRRFALAHGESAFRQTSPAWQRKREFLCLVHADAIAEFQTSFDPAAHRLAIAHRGREVFAGDVSKAEERQKADAAFNAVLKDRRGPLKLVDASDIALADQQAPLVSFINLASVRDLGEKAGAALDSLRFRGNILVEGLEPWAEFDWVGKTVSVGAVTFNIAKRIDRCMATAVNPATASRDVDVLKVLRESFGHIDCGVFGEVTQGGSIRTGEAIAVP